MYRAEIAALAKGDVESLNWPEGCIGCPPVTCNIFVHDILTQAADAIGQSQNFSAPMRPRRSRFLFTRVDPFLAADWASPYIAGCWQPLEGGPDAAEPGDVLATGYPPNGPDGTGHVGIVVQPDSAAPNWRFVSAASDPPYWWTDAQKALFAPGTVTLTDYGFRLPGYDPVHPTASYGLKADSRVKRFKCF